MKPKKQQLSYAEGAISKSGRFAHFASKMSSLAGRPATFMLACIIIAVWAVSGPVFGYSNTWQLVINTGTTIITFLMVFIIQNTQNREGRAVQIKLDELIRAIEGAQNSLLDLEDLTDEELERIRRKYLALAERARAHLEDDSERGRPA
jgi:low affinity Fe/Cu permease